MTKKTSVYVKKFSQISGLQKSETVEYFLLTTREKDFDVYGIEVLSGDVKKDAIEKQDLKRISYSKDYVLDILKYLYENSIKPEATLGIVLDILNINKIEKSNSLVLE